VNAKVRQKLARRKRRIQRRLKKSDLRGCSKAMFTASNIQYEIGDRGRGMVYGGIGAMHLLVRKLGLAEAIDDRLHLLKFHLPYHESDHVLNFAYNALCDGTCLEDIELRRNDEVFLDALGARRIPDPTTAGDFCRRFTPADVHTLLDVFNDIRIEVWAGQPDEFFAQARIDLDCTLVDTTGECKQGMDIAYNGTWGYHSLVVSLANTNEVLSVINPCAPGIFFAPHVLFRRIDRPCLGQKRKHVSGCSARGHGRLGGIGNPGRVFSACRTRGGS
jgi:hypothetical protein